MIIFYNFGLVFENTFQVNETSFETKKPTSGNTQKNNYGFFCIEEDFVEDEDISSLSLDDIRELNVKYARTLSRFFKWDAIEQEKGVYNFTKTDYIVGQASDANVSLIVTFLPYARWDQESVEGCCAIKEEKGRKSYMCTCNPQNWTAYELFLREIVERYDGDDDFGNYPISDSLKEKIKRNPVLFWEINNEPDGIDPSFGIKGFNGDVEDYFEQLKRSYEIIKDVCENCEVIVAAPTPEDPEGFYSELVSLGGSSYFDMYNFHTIRYYERPTDIFSGTDKPVIYTETGGGRGSEIAKQVLTLIGNNVSIACVSRSPLKDKYYSSLSKGVSENEFFESTLLYENGSRTEQYLALQKMATELKDFNSYKKIQTDGVAAYIFYFDYKDPVYVFYLDCNGVDSALFNPGLKKFSVEDLFGEKKTLSQPFEIQNGNVYFIQLAGKDAEPVNYGLVGEYNCRQSSKREKEHKEEDREKNEDQSQDNKKKNVTNQGICGDNYCTIEEANSNSCPQDCTNRFCGDGICDEMETKELCPQDCS